MNKKSFFIISISTWLLFACSSSESEETRTVDQATFLQNTASIIINDYATLLQELNELNSSVDSLIASTNSVTLTQTKKELKESYIAWQKVSMYDFGPAETFAVKSSVNIFKTDTAQIELNIITGNYNLDQIAMKDAKGFPALDYLLHAQNENTIIQTISNQGNRKQYLRAVSRDIQSKVSQIAMEWNAYQSTFKNAFGTDVGSSTGILINNMNLHFEKYLRDNKIGIPLGIRSSGIPRPTYSEAYYGGYSIDLVKANFEAMKILYFGADNYGLDDYLKDSGAADLDNRIRSQFLTIDLKLNALSGPLPSMIKNESGKLLETYNEMQKLIILWKVDLPSRIGVLITYQDNDGD